MHSYRLQRQGCLWSSVAVLVISIILAYVLRAWHLFPMKAVKPHDLPFESSSHTAETSPDTTAVVLNWSRFSNVRRIAKLLCSPELTGVVHTVLIWNNNPKPVSYEVRVIFNSTLAVYMPNEAAGFR